MKTFEIYLIVGLLLASYTLSGQNKDLALSEKVTAMAKVGACYSPSFSPDGKEIAFISNMSGIPQIWKMSSSGGWPIQLTNFDDPVSNAMWSPKDNTIAFQIAPGGGMNSQIYKINSDGSDVKRLTSGGISNNWIGLWSKNGQYLSYSSNVADASGGMDSYIFNIQDGDSKLIAKNNGIGTISDINSKNGSYLLNRLVSRGSNDVYLIDEESGEKLLTAHEGPGSFFGRFSPQGEVYLETNLDRDKIAFGKVVNDKIVILAERPDAELQNFIINNQGTLALLFWNVGGKNSVSTFDLKSETEGRNLDLSVELVGGGRFSNDDRYFIYTGNGSTEPSNIWKYDFRDGSSKKLTHSPHPGVDLKSLITPELVKFNSFDGLELSGWMYTPDSGNGPFPTVISYHGGPEGQSRPFFSYTFQALLSQGIAVFSPNVRGSSGFGKRFVNLDNGALRVNGVKDIKACVDYIVSEGIADAEMIGIMGGSYGGYMVMAGITEYPEMFAAAANLFGVVNFKTFFENTEPWMAAISKVEYGDPDTQAEMLHSISPINKVDKAITPTIVLHGANDTNVPVVEAEQVVENLKERRIPVEYVLFPDEGHGWRKTKNKVKSTLAIVEWFEKYLVRK